MTFCAFIPPKVRSLDHNTRFALGLEQEQEQQQEQEEQQEEEQPHTASENNSSETNFFIKITFDNSRLIPPSNCFKTTSKTKNFAEGLKYQVVCVCVSDLVRETRISEVF